MDMPFEVTINDSEEDKKETVLDQRKRAMRVGWFSAM